jgi:RNA polymerase sigma-70 factor (ECF subfamily)
MKMVGSLADAEDIVQDTFTKWLSKDHQKIQNTKAYLISAVTNNCLNHLNSLIKKKEEYIDHIKLGEISNRYMEFELPRFDFDVEIAAALAIINKKLAPLERAIFLLREVFGFEYEDLQILFDKKKDNCRKIFSRAKEKLDPSILDLHFEVPVPSSMVKNFINACNLGAPADFLNDLKQDITAKLTPLMEKM